MKIHEYQAKQVLSRFGVPVPRGEVAFAPAEASDIARRLGGDLAVVKAQIHAGGRGKGGGVKVVRSPDEAERVAKQMIVVRLTTLTFKQFDQYEIFVVLLSRKHLRFLRWNVRVARNQVSHQTTYSFNTLR